MSRFHGASGFVALLFIAFGVYYFFYVRSQITYFTARNLRLIGTIASQIEGSVRTFKTVMWQPAKLPDSDVRVMDDLGLKHSREDVFGPVCQQTHVREFEDVIIANAKGEVIWNCAKSRVMSLSKVVSQTGWEDAKVLAFPELQQAGRHTRIVFGGSAFRLFSQPLREVGGGPHGAWVVAGIVSDARFNRESLTISYTLLVVGLAVLVLAVLALPYLRLGLIGELQRVRLSDVLLLGVSTLLGVAILTLILHDVVGYQLMRRVCDKQLRHLGSDIKHHMLKEIRLAAGVLEELDEKLPADLNDACALAADDFRLPSVQAYPFFESFHRMNAKGRQIARRSTEPRPTDLVKDVGGREYFQGVRDGKFTKDHYVIQSLFSMNTASTVAVISKRSKHYRPADSEGPMVSAVTFPMRSLIEPVVAAGYGFAIIDQEGSVLFHSDSQRNTFENFFEETDHDPALRAAAFGRQNEIMSLRYWGADHRAFVTPVDGTPWTLVTFRNKRLIRALNVETIVITLMFLAVYTLAFALVLATIAIVHPSYRAPWIWFDKECVYDYRRLIYAYGAFAVSLAASIYLFKPRALVVIAFLVPVMALLLTYVRLKRMRGMIAKTALVMLGICYAVWLTYANRSHIEQGVAIHPLSILVLIVIIGSGAILCGLLPPWRKEKSRPDVRRHLLVPGYAYGWAATLLLAVVAALPTGAFFKAAFRIETESFVKFGQADLIEQFTKRWEVLQERAQRLRADAVVTDRALSPRVETLIQRRHDDGLDLYYRFFFDTTLIAAEAKAQPPRVVSRESAPVPSLLERLLPHYSKESVRMRELLHSATKDQDQWRWQRHETILEFAPKVWPGRSDVVVWSKASRIFDIPWLLEKASPRIPGRVLYFESNDYTDVEAEPDDVGFTLKASLLVFGVIAYLAAIVWVIRFINKKIFLVDVGEPLWLKPGQKIGPALSGNLLIFTNDLSRTLASIQRESFIDVSAADFSKGGTEMFWRDLMSRIDMQPAGRGVLIADFDSPWENATVRAELLRFIDRVTTVHHRNVLILTGTSPWVLFGEIAKKEAARWKAILGSFTVRTDDGMDMSGPPQKRPDYGKPLGESLDEFLDLIRRVWSYVRTNHRLPLRVLLPGLAERLRFRMRQLATRAGAHMDISELMNGSEKHTVRLIERECFGSPFLVQLGEELNAQKTVRGEEQLFDEIGDRAVSYYATLWARSSKAEKIVLQHLAEDGFANVNDRQTLRRLMARGMIRRKPHFELMNETFRRFVLATPRRREVAEIHTHTSPSTWDKIEKPLLAGLVCAGVFFIATQRELFDITMSMVTAVATGVPTLVRLAGFFAEPRALLNAGKS